MSERGLIAKMEDGLRRRGRYVPESQNELVTVLCFLTSAEQQRMIISAFNQAAFLSKRSFMLICQRAIQWGHELVRLQIRPGCYNVIFMNDNGIFHFIS